MRSWGQERSRPPAATMTTERWASTGGGRRPGSDNAAAWTTAAEDKFMGYRANERGKLSEDFVAAGDGLVAFGAVFILAVQTHYGAAGSVAGQAICPSRSHPQQAKQLDNQCSQIRSESTCAAQSREGNWGPPQNSAGWQPPGHRSRGRAALPTTPTPALERRAAAAGRCTPRRSRGRLKDGCRRPEPCGVCSAFSGKGQQCADVTAVGSLKSSDVLLPQG